MKFDLKKLKSLPGPQKANFAFAVASVFAGLVGVIWFTTLGARFADGPLPEEIVKEELPKIVEGEKGDGQTWGEFMGTVGSQVGSIIEGFKSIKIETGAEDRNSRTVGSREEPEAEENAPTPESEVANEPEQQEKQEETRPILVGTGAVKSAE